ncbi:MAG: hypothetical protein P4L93_04785 [Coriobacteriia bacterium]|nr:hypothetical protein [Coriobacteriia bacterium]
MRPNRDIAVLAVSVVLFATVLSVVAWVLPKVNYNPEDALIVIPVASVILSARGASWRRRLLYAGLVIGVFLLVDFAFLASGLMQYSFAGLSQLDPLPSVLAVVYLFFAQGFPFVVLILFAGRNPSMLWTKPRKR